MNKNGHSTNKNGNGTKEVRASGKKESEHQGVFQLSTKGIESTKMQVEPA